MSSSKRLAGATMLVMIAAVVSRFTGFLRNVLITAKMQPAGFSDEFLAAFQLPNLMYDLLVGGAIVAAIIPVLSASISKDMEKSGWRAVSTFINITIYIMMIVGAMCMIFTPQIVSIIAAGYNEQNQEQFITTVRLTRILLPSSFFMILAGQCNGILNAYHKFAVAAFGPAVYNLCTVFSIFMFGSKSAEATSWGVTISAGIFFILQFSFTIKHMKFYRFKINIRDPLFHKLFSLAVPALLSSAIVQLNTTISRSLTTILPEGRLTSFNNADRTWQLPLGIFAQSVGITLLPTLSAKFSSGDKEEFKRILIGGLKTVLMLAIPSAFGFILLGKEIMSILFLWKGIDYENILYSGATLMIFGIALIYQSLVTIMNRAFYSINNTKVPLFTGFITIVANYIFAVIFINKTSLDIVGMALAATIGMIINAFMLMIIFRRKTGIDIIKSLGGFVFKIVISCVAMTVIILLTKTFLKPESETKIIQTLMLIFQIILGGITYYMLTILLKVEEVRYATGYFISKLEKRFKKVV